MIQNLGYSDCLHEIVACFDRTLRHTYANHRVQRSTGLQSQDFIGKTNLELGIAPALAQHWDQQIRAVMDSGISTDLQFEFAGPRGTIRFSTRLKPDVDANGHVASVVAVARGFQEESALPHVPLDADTEAAHYRAIVESSDDAIISKTLDGTITSWNQGAQKIFGYSAHEMLGKPMRLLFPIERMTEEDLILERLREGEKVDHFETVRLRKDGTLIDVSVTISPIFDKSGQIVGASKIARDISYRKNSEARLRLIASAFTHTGEAVAILSTRGEILDVNSAFTSITGYTRDDVLGKDFHFFHSSRQSPDMIERLGNDLQIRGHCQGEIWSRRKDGAAFAGLLTVSAARGVEGLVQSYVAQFADITELRIQQEQLEHVAHFDALTDLPNRLLLADRLQQAMAVAQRQQQTLAVLYLDLDGFKQINDTYGHAAGDALLVAVSHRMRRVLREVDTLARLGGDEFVAVLADVQGLEECRTLIDRLLKACADPVMHDSHVMQVSASIGLTLYPRDNSDADGLIRHADGAMYQAKQSGKNRFFVFQPTQAL